MNSGGHTLVTAAHRLRTGLIGGGVATLPNGRTDEHLEHHEHLVLRRVHAPEPSARLLCWRLNAVRDVRVNVHAGWRAAQRTIDGLVA